MFTSSLPDFFCAKIAGMGFLAFFDVTLFQLVAILFVALLVGMGKAGLSSTVIVAIPILAAIWGGRQSTGLMLLLLLLGDLFAVKAYHRGTRWDEMKKLIPAAFLGILAGAVTGNFISDQHFKMLIAVVVLVCLLLMLYQEYKGADFKVPQNRFFAFLTGILSGFASMIGNAAGPIFAVYLLAIGLNKKNYLGTVAVFFFIVNLLKLPIQVFVWQSIQWQSALLVLLAVPLVYAGIRLGFWLIARLNERHFRYLMLAMTFVAAIRLFF